MNEQWVTLISAVLASGLTGGGVVALVNALARRRVTKVDAADRLNESTLEWAAAVKADAADARRDASEARREAADARREMGMVRQEAEALAKELRQLRLAILDPFATLEQLRAMVGGGGSSNGIMPVTDRR